MITQINYSSLKYNTQDSIEQTKGQSHEDGLNQIFMLHDMQFGGVDVIYAKAKENRNKIKKLSREQTLVASKHPPTENQNWS